MSLTTIRNQIATTLGNVSGIGTIHKYDRWSADWTTFLNLFKDTNNKINGWMITRTGAPERWQSISDYERVHEFMIRGIYGLKDADASEHTFQALIEDICTAFRSDDTLNGTCDTTSPDFGSLKGASSVQVALTENRMFGTVLCHYCELRLAAQEIRTTA